MATDILIVGAGAAGLMAAQKLSEAGKKVVILEARSRIGGRIFPLSKDTFGYEAMGGAEFVHGEAPLTRQLLSDAGATLDHAVEWWDVRDGEPLLIDHGSHLDKVSETDALLISKLKELDEDTTVDTFLQTHFAGDEHIELRTLTIQRVEGYDAADAQRASALALYEEMIDEGGYKQNSIKEGYGLLLKHLEEQCLSKGVQILVNEEVRAIDFSGSVVVVQTQNSNFTANQVVVTVPLPILKTIHFTPAVPEKLAAAEKIGFGAVVKVVVRFKTKWWSSPEREKNFEKMFFMFSYEKIPTWWTQYPEPRNVLTGWLAGPKAEAFATSPDKEVLAAALESLSNIFKIGVSELQQELVASSVNNWPKEPFTKIGYSYETPESEEAINELSTPVVGKLFFAGEAISHEGITSTVEAALNSGQTAAKKILKL